MNHEKKSIKRAYVIVSKNQCPHHQDMGKFIICNHPNFIFGDCCTKCEGPSSEMCPLPLFNDSTTTNKVLDAALNEGKGVYNP